MALVDQLPTTVEEGQKAVAWLATFVTSILAANQYTAEETLNSILAFDEVWGLYESEILATFGLTP